MTGRRSHKPSIRNGNVRHNTAWPSLRIDSVGEVQAGRQRSEKIVAGTPRKYLRVANVFDGYIDYSNVYEMPFTDRETDVYSLQRGDILLNEGTSAGETEKENGMALTQMQIIQSLGEAMDWFERERNWGVPATELRHLCGRIGELYAALITNGQMATNVNQQGYDVVSGDGERVSVKTTAMMGTGGHVLFNPATLHEVDRVIVLRINTEEMQIETLLNTPKPQALDYMSVDKGGKYILPLGRLVRKPKERGQLKTVKEVAHEGYTVRELENGTIEVEQAGALVVPAKPVLRALAQRLNLSLLNANGNPYNTRQLGSQVIRTIQELKRTEPTTDP